MGGLLCLQLSLSLSLSISAFAIVASLERPGDSGGFLELRGLPPLSFMLQEEVTFMLEFPRPTAVQEVGLVAVTSVDPVPSHELAARALGPGLDSDTGSLCHCG